MALAFAWGWQLQINSLFILAQLAGHPVNHLSDHLVGHLLCHLLDNLADHLLVHHLKQHEKHLTLSWQGKTFEYSPESNYFQSSSSLVKIPITKAYRPLYHIVAFPTSCTCCSCLPTISTQCAGHVWWQVTYCAGDIGYRR